MSTDPGMMALKEAAHRSISTLSTDQLLDLYEGLYDRDSDLECFKNVLDCAREELNRRLDN